MKVWPRESWWRVTRSWSRGEIPTIRRLLRGVIPYPRRNNIKLLLRLRWQRPRSQLIRVNPWLLTGWGVNLIRLPLPALQSLG